MVCRVLGDDLIVFNRTTVTQYINILRMSLPKEEGVISTTGPGSTIATISSTIMSVATRAGLQSTTQGEAKEQEHDTMRKLSITKHTTTRTADIPWDDKAMNELLRRGMFDPLYEELLHRYEHYRCTLAATWCDETAISGGHVPLLYLVVRNACRYANGCVLTQRGVRSVLSAFVLLVLRVVQDTVALQRTQGLRAADNVYKTLITCKLRPWLSNIKPEEAWPPLRDVLTDVSALPIVQDVAQLPDHSWITSVRFTGISTVRFGTPDPDLRMACQGSTDAVGHRSDVKDHFFSVAQPMEWNNFLSAPLEMFIPRVRKDSNVHR